ncbi:MAG: T9SS type A sorting domain-containing protein [Bacteroidetes bacterium]|nr:T9SS type A sorting domain-containing protein [Bacteroidota bacterium]
MKIIYKVLTTAFLFLATLHNLQAQPNSITWQKTLGGISDEVATSIIQTTDGGYAIAGYTSSNDGDVTGNHGGDDYWVAKLSSTGSLIWQQTFGGTGQDQAYSIIQTTDGGYAVAGFTLSNDGDVTGNHGNADGWIVKLSISGIVQWQKTLGGTSSDYANSIIQTTDGGYAIACSAGSSNGDVTFAHGMMDCWVVKLDGTGSLQWQRAYGGTGNEVANSIVQTTDGGYAIAGYAGSYDGDVTGNHNGGFFDSWVVKLDGTNGSLQWQKTYGGSRNDGATSIIQTTDGGYAIAGSTNSNDGDVTGNHGLSDFWEYKLSNTGILQWQNVMGGTGDDYANSIIQTTNGGYEIAGSTNSSDGDLTFVGNKGMSDYWVHFVDSNGNYMNGTYGGTGNEVAYSMIQTTDGGYAIAGSTGSNDGDVTGNHGMSDFWVVKLEGLSSGIQDTKADEGQIALYPNPATNQLFIETNGTPVEEINIYNTTGSLVSQTKQPQSKSIDISQLAQGVYVAEINFACRSCAEAGTKEASVKRRWVKM